MTPITIKCWLLDGVITFEEAKWIHEIGARVDISPAEHEDFEYHGRIFKMYKSRGSIKIYTRDEDAETLLLLKYSDRLQLSTTEWVVDTGECTLSEVNIEAYNAW